MAAKKSPANALPLMMENDQTPSATITYANEVVAIIAGLAANEVEGIAGMCNISSNILNKNRNVTRGVKVEIGTEEVAVDLYVIVEYGTPIQRAAMDAQESVRKAIESMTGLHVVRVDVHVQSVSFEQENKALQAGAASAALEAGVIDRDEEAEEKTKTPLVSEKLEKTKKKDPEPVPEKVLLATEEKPEAKKKPVQAPHVETKEEKPVQVPHAETNEEKPVQAPNAETKEEKSQPAPKKKAAPRSKKENDTEPVKKGNDPGE